MYLPGHIISSIDPSLLPQAVRHEEPELRRLTGWPGPQEPPQPAPLPSLQTSPPPLLPTEVQHSGNDPAGD